MSSLPLVMGLLLLAYLGSFVALGKGSFATSSNVGWIVLGFVLGPYVLNVVGETLLEAATPVVTIASGWGAFATGVRVFGLEDAGTWRTSALGVATGTLTALVASTLVWFVLPLLFPAFAVDSGPRFAVSVTAGAIASGSGRDLGATRPDAPASEKLLARIARAEVVVPVLCSQVALAFVAKPSLGVLPLPFVVSFSLTLVLGPLLGALTVPLFGREFGLREGWGALFGMCALAVGLSVRFGASVVWVLFSLGATLVRFSHHRDDIRAIVAPTERSLLLPLLVVVGAKLDLGTPIVLVEAVLAFVLVRVVVRIALLSPVWGNARARALGGLAALPVAPLTLVIALSANTRFPHGAGALLAPLAVVLAAVGELVAPLALRTLQKGSRRSVEARP